MVTWASLVKDLLNSLGLGDYWVYQTVGNANWFLSLAKQRLIDIHQQEWRGEVECTSTHRLYKHIKPDFRFETYLDMKCKAWRIAITKIRLSSHQFMIERGIWGNNRLDEVKERLCNTCKEVEDEYHCIITCPKFANQREICFLVPNRLTFLKYMKVDTETLQRKMGQLCYKVMSEYRKELFT